MPWEQLFESARAHGLLLNSFHQHDTALWCANWRIVAGRNRKFSTPATDERPLEALSKSLMVAITEIAPDIEPDIFG